MGMRKDREITIIRESSTHTRGKIGLSLAEALAGDSFDTLLSLHEGFSIDEERVKLPGHTKETPRYLDQHPNFREIVQDQSIAPGKTRSIDFNIDGVPVKNAVAASNKKGIIRAYTDQAEPKKDWVRSDSTVQDPVIEITPTQQTPAPEENPYADAEDAIDADRQQSQQEPEDAAGEEEGPGPDGPPDHTDDDYLQRDTQERPPHDLEITDDDENNVPTDDDRREGEGDDGGATDYGDKDPDEMPQEPQGEEQQGGEGGTGTPPTPTGSVKDISDYIDKVAHGEEGVNLSEVRRPMHKRSLIDLLYSS